MQSPRPGGFHKKPNHERWIISYADLLTLLLALFVVLFASSTRNQYKLEQEAESLMQAFNGNPRAIVQTLSAGQGIMQHQPSVVAVMHPTPQVTHVRLPAVRPVTPPQPVDAGPVAPHLSSGLSQKLEAEALALERARQTLELLLQPLTSAHQVTIQATPLMLTISLNAAVLFNTGDATLLPAAAQLLTNVSGSLKNLPQPFTIGIQGYTDDRPINTAQFPSNWSLSVERAVSVVQLFVADGIDGGRLAAEGFSEYQPIASNTTDAGRAKNRRVLIVIRARDINDQ